MNPDICFTQKLYRLDGSFVEIKVKHRMRQDPKAFLRDWNGNVIFPHRLYTRKVCQKCGWTSFIGGMRK